MQRIHLKVARVGQRAEDWTDLDDTGADGVDIFRGSRRQQSASLSHGANIRQGRPDHRRRARNGLLPKARAQWRTATRDEVQHARSGV